MDNKWTLNNLPPINHEDVAEFAFHLFEIARIEKDRLNKSSDFLTNYALYRGHSGRQLTGRKGYTPQSKNLTPINLYFANVERTVSNITARNPTGEVVDMDGLHDGVENILSLKLKKWWKDTDQQIKTRTTARMMEIYGITTEKPIRNPRNNFPDILIADPFSFFPAPGNWDDISMEAPYITYLYLDFVSEIESAFGVSNIAADEAYELLGQEREVFKTQNVSLMHTIGNYADPMTIRNNISQTTPDRTVERGLIIELWVRDNQTKDVVTSEPILQDGQPVIGEDGSPRRRQKDHYCSKQRPW
jgi:hypothetical protein